ncbi:MAG: DUF3791 domain-containing protein [Lachnospiraceae bacterium]|nr:DUF3791 domain-containing protein [Lachnospiraceae bacterium]
MIKKNEGRTQGFYSRKNLEHLTLDKALNFFYNSEVYQLMKDGVSDMHCMSEEYLIEDLSDEYEKKFNSGRRA